MKVTEHLERAKRPVITFEIIPPLRGGSLQKLLTLIDDLVSYKPPFIDITSHAAQVEYVEGPEGLKKMVRRKRPGTIGVCALIQNKYNVDAVPHVICVGFTREETEDFLIELNYLGIDNVLAIKGDDNGFRKPLNYGRSANSNALELVEQIEHMNGGQYLDDFTDADPTNFSVGVSGYPEKHFEAPNMEADLRNTRAKLDAGAEYVVTQMFYNNQHYFEYLELCGEHGIDCPVIPGLKILTSKRQLSTLPRLFNCEIPAELSEAVEAAGSKAEVVEIGVDWAHKQAEELLNRGAPSLHFYVMQSSKAIKMLMDRLDI